MFTWLVHSYIDFRAEMALHSFGIKENSETYSTTAYLILKETVKYAMFSAISSYYQVLEDN